MILSILINLLLLAVVYRMYGNIYDLKSDLKEEESKADFWKEKANKLNNAYVNIEYLRTLLSKYQRLNNTLLDEMDQLIDKRKFNGTKHNQRSKANSPAKQS